MAKSLTKSQLLSEVAERSGITKKQVGEVLDALRDVVVEQLKGKVPVTLPGLLKLTLKDKPATEARPGKNPFTGEDIMIKAKPAFKAVKALPLKALKDAVA